MHPRSSRLISGHNNNNNNCAPQHTDVVIIGNGPAGLALSAFLSGVTPIYSRQHPVDKVHDGLVADADLGLLEQDLSFLQDGDELGGSTRPMSALYDSLMRPLIDVGEQHPSCIEWERRSDRTVPHIVLGSTHCGGSWNNYDPKMIAVSKSSFFDLPGSSAKVYVQKYYDLPTTEDPRTYSMDIVDYMQMYPVDMCISESIWEGTTVDRVRKQSSGRWLVSARDAAGEKFQISARRVVLACGKTSQKRLQVDGELDCDRLVYDVPSMKARLKRDREAAAEHTLLGGKRKVVVIGDGISAADAINHCLEEKIPVVHVVRRNSGMLRNVLLSRLTHYPEYNKVYQLMIGRTSDPLYTKHVQTVVKCVDEEMIRIATPKGVEEIPVGLVVACLGRESSFSSCLDGDYSFPDYFSEEDPSLAAVGSYVGDHFVRYLIGGCLQVARTILAADAPPP